MNKNCNSAAAERKRSGAYAPFKRALDLIFAALGLIFAAVPMLVISLCIRLELGESAIFTQQRVGRGGKLFNCYKFRTMKTEAPRSCSKKSWKTRTTSSPVPAASCARRVWTSCRGCSTSCGEI